MNLREEILSALAERSAEPGQLARRLGVSRWAVLSELRAMGHLVDFHEPPAPCGDDCACWYLRRQAVAA